MPGSDHVIIIIILINNFCPVKCISIKVLRITFFGGKDLRHAVIRANHFRLPSVDELAGFGTPGWAVYADQHITRALNYADFARKARADYRTGERALCVLMLSRSRRWL
jgi:hypothetical protein